MSDVVVLNAINNGKIIEEESVEVIADNLPGAVKDTNIDYGIIKTL